MAIRPYDTTNDTSNDASQRATIVGCGGANGAIPVTPFVFVIVSRGRVRSRDRNRVRSCCACAAFFRLALREPLAPPFTQRSGLLMLNTKGTPRTVIPMNRLLGQLLDSYDRENQNGRHAKDSPAFFASWLGWLWL